MAATEKAGAGLRKIQNYSAMGIAAIQYRLVRFSARPEIAGRFVPIGWKIISGSKLWPAAAFRFLFSNRLQSSLSYHQ